MSPTRVQFEPRLHYPGGFETLRVEGDPVCTTRRGAHRLGARYIREMAPSESERRDMMNQLEIVRLHEHRKIARWQTGLRLLPA